MRLILLLFISAWLVAAQQEPANFIIWKRPPAFTLKGSTISGVWQVEHASINVPQPVAYLSAVVQGDAVSITGGLTIDKSALTGAGWFVNPLNMKKAKAAAASPTHWVQTYPTYKVYIGGSSMFAGWWTLVAKNYNTILLFQGEEPDITYPPEQMPGQPIFKRMV